MTSLQKRKSVPTNAVAGSAGRPISGDEAALHELARRCGVQVRYDDVNGRQHTASADTLVAVLAALGQEVAAVVDAPAALRAYDAHEQLRAAPRHVVVWDGGQTQLQVGADVTSASLVLEDGGEQPLHLARGLATIPAGVAQGYHTLKLDRPSGTICIDVTSAPRQAWQPARATRGWGVFVPLYSLRADGDWGAGDFASLAKLQRLMGGHGATLVGSTPLFSAYTDECSPYSPVSRLHWNELYLDLTALPELSAAQVQQQQLVDGNELHARAREAQLIDYAAVWKLRRTVLEQCTRVLLESDGARRADFESWVASHPDVVAYAEFRASRDRDGQHLREGVDVDRLIAREYHLYSQWCMRSQLDQLMRGGGGPTTGSEPGTGLYLDMPVGVHADGYDVLRHPGIFATTVSTGAPPDLLGPQGQDWALPPLLPDRMLEYFRDSIRELFRYADAARIDHVMGLHRLFWVPSGMSPADGTYVSYPHDQLWAVVTLESHRSRTVVVGEDLGTVPPEVRLAMREHNVRRSYVMQFELQPETCDLLHPAPSESLAALNTHDTPTFAGYWRGLTRKQKDGVARFLRTRGFLSDDQDSEEAIVEAALRTLAASPAELAVINLEDLWAESEPQNRPGTTADEHPNWQRRTARTVEQIADDPRIARVLHDVDTLRRKVPRS